MSTAMLERIETPSEQISPHVSWAIGAEAYPALEAESHRRCAELVGRAMLHGSVEITDVPVPEVTAEIKEVKTLHSSLIGARNDIEQDDKLVDINIDTEVAERLFAAGHETEIELHVDEDNELVQNGIKLTDVSINTLRYMSYEGIMQDRSKSELHNGVFFNLLHEKNVLDDNVAVVFSHTPTNEQVKEDYGFFENDALSVQLIKKIGPNRYVMQTAFVAGKSAIDGERHDLDAVKMLALENGVDVMSDDTESMISRVVIIPVDQVPLGVTTVVQRLDESAGGTFYGESKPQQDYAAYSKECRARDFAVITSKIKLKLLQEAPTYTSPSDAVERLDYWSRKYCLEQALKDDTIDSAAFGSVASAHLQQARLEYAQGNMFEVNRLFKLAKETDASGSCPFKKGASKDGNKDDPLSGESSSVDSNDDTESSGEKKMTCPFCKESTIGDPCSSSLTCDNCSASTACSQSENEYRAAEYKLDKIRKLKERKIKAIVKKSKEATNGQFAIAA